MQAFIVGVMMLVVLCAPVDAATIRVPADAGTIQDGIDAAAVGDTVLVAPGSYVERIAITSAITVRSEEGPDATIIDGGGSGPVVTLGGTGVLEGFTVRNGYASFDAAGIDVQSGAPSILGNHVVDNRGCSGIGIAVRFSSALVQGNLIARNWQWTCSGGTGGGGILIGGAGSARIVDNVIEDNVVTSSDGGGIALFAAGTPTISGNVIRRNVASGTSGSKGGGISLVNASNALIVQNTIVGNRAEVQGGGVAWGVPSGQPGPLLLNNTIAGNVAPTGSQVFADGFDRDTRLVNNVIVAPGGSVPVVCGTFNDPNPPVFDHNDVFAGGTTPYGGLCTDQTGTNGNVSVDPMFVDPGAGDYHLAPGSPVIDAGISPTPFLPAKDVDDDARIIDGNGDDVDAVDLGVDEALARDVAFAMTVRARVALRAPGRDRFRVTGTFSLPTGSDIDPPSEPVALRLSDSGGPFFLERLEPGAFVQRGAARWGFVAPRGKTGIVRVSIRPTSAAGTFRVSIRARGLDLATSYDRAPIDVLLRLGDDVATVTSR